MVDLLRPVSDQVVPTVVAPAVPPPEISYPVGVTSDVTKDYAPFLMFGAMALVLSARARGLLPSGRAAA